LKRLRITAAIATLVVAAVAAGPAAAAPGGNSDAAHACQHDGWKTRFDPATGAQFKNQGDCVSSAARGSRGPSLVVFPTVSADGTFWGVTTGSGLMHGSRVTVGASSESGFPSREEFLLTVGDDGTITFGPEWTCGQGFHDFNASGTTASGDPINSNTIATSPCG